MLCLLAAFFVYNPKKFGLLRVLSSKRWIYQQFLMYIHSQKKKVLNRTLKGSSAQRSAGTFKGSRWNPLEMVIGGTIPEEP